MKTRLLLLLAQLALAQTPALDIQGHRGGRELPSPPCAGRTPKKEAAFIEDSFSSFGVHKTKKNIALVVSGFLEKEAAEKASFENINADVARSGKPEREDSHPSYLHPTTRQSG